MHSGEGSWEPPADVRPLLESYSRPDSGLRRFEASGLGTLNAILLGTADHTTEELEDAAHVAFSLLEMLEARLSKFQPESDVSLLNTLGGRQATTIGPEILELLQCSRRAWELTDGAFDPTVGPLMRAWGLDDMEGRLPDDAEIESLLERRGMDLVEIDADHSTARFTRPGVALDLGGIGKGYVADRLARSLADGGVRTGAVLLGSSTIVAWGSPPGEDGWRVDIVHPHDRSSSLAEITIDAGAVSTSGAAERQIQRHGHTIGHILDPRSGRPVETIAGATAWTTSALIGDVLSTTVFVLGPDALSPGGAGRKLVEAWTPPGSSPRASILLATNDPGAWGGVASELVHIGEPGFRESSGSS